MYIWVILATFMVTLYAFNLSPRTDMRRLEVEPVAEAIVSKLVIKQQAAGRYIRSQTPPYAKFYNEDGSSTAADNLLYTSGIIGDEIKSFLPYGFKNDDKLQAEIYCTDPETESTIADCTVKENKRYMVTYTKIPQRWLNVVTGLPNNDFINAMKTIIGNEKSFGFAGCYEKDIDSSGVSFCKTWAIRSKEGFESTYWKDGEKVTKVNKIIPPVIAKTGGFSEMCGENNNSGGLCLMYLYEYANNYYGQTFSDEIKQNETTPQAETGTE